MDTWVTEPEKHMGYEAPEEQNDTAKYSCNEYAHD
jgi:hypothetical protein